jgi:hypothetical protein
MIVYLLLGFIVFQSVIHYYERKDLYNRIMSKNLTEYKGEPGRRFRSAHERVMERWRKTGGEDKT